MLGLPRYLLLGWQGTVLCSVWHRSVSVDADAHGGCFSLGSQNEYNMGEIGFDPLGLCPTDPKEKYDMQTKELNNGRRVAPWARCCALPCACT